jgi:4-hydroxybenzoate polyprenyltransferase
MAKYLDYIKIARPDHWLKNLFVLPGFALAFFFFPELFTLARVPDMILGLVATCFVASSNYVVNELLDAEYDRFHPVKKHRPLAAGRVSRPVAWMEWVLLAAIGLGLGFFVNAATGWACLTLWIAGTLYNVPPIRTKELPYLDVISESSNNPIRLAIGWFAAGAAVMPPLSAVFGYWMFGAFLMATKRFAEYRRIGDPEQAANYRRSFSFYNEERLIVGIVFYIALFILGASVFIMQYQYELVLGMPFLAYMVAYYLYLGFQPDSPVQYPELLYKERHLMLSLILCTVFFLALFYIDFPIVEDWFQPLI